ncbi:hypothetical protein BAUCODRAFT_31776 [Baudoinia panamericana UAMH 10762]|uniref:Uncharacterized protein n=1 Tax=Baudoinia panamericana (strain UAMH 10762) TaxID=717646 RepID=M2LTC6_BAUPA|nr:uncharacterized protein BAUCODRAFT_31776 [Baudoinia panamericana UAMH 10762]EMC97782.1 hypothetical protein BAUCODRAFT_31776 [Baudoinia panamericana UAMH 10762]
MTARQAYLDYSFNASMDDYEAPAREFSPTMPFDLPSQHSGFRSNVASEYSESGSSRRSYSPPAWRKAGSGWFKHPSLSPTRERRRSKESSPQYAGPGEEGDDGDVTAYRIATTVPLPGSPTKGRSPSNSPEAEVRPGAQVDRGGGGGGGEGRLPPETHVNNERESAEPDTPTQSNYFRFSTRLDVVQRTQPIEDTISSVRKLYHNMTESKWHTFGYVMGAIAAWMLAINLLSTPNQGPVPDLVKVAGFAKSLEPAIYYSERGHAQIGELQETGVAVWDLGESVRNTNMTSAPIIVNQLDDLSDSIKTLAIELTRFFSGVDGDIDNILLMMEWAQRELTAISNLPTSGISTIWSNTYSLLTRIGLVSQGQLAQSILGQTQQQLTRSTLERVFHEYLNVLEETISNEITYSMQLFQLFEVIDKQFLNLQRSVIREQDTQERLENEFLSTLWTKVIGVNASKLRKYEKNKDLLASVRDRTVRNKHILVDHNQRLRQLQSNLETLRRKLVSPLVRSQNSSTLSVEEQIKGLEGTYVQLKSSREVQRRKMLEVVYGAGDRRHGSPSYMIGEPSLEARVVGG